MKDFARIYFIVFAVLTIFGGIVGYVRKRSVASIIAGGISGVLLLLAAWLIHSKPNGALILALVVSVSLAGRFVPSYIETKKPGTCGVDVAAQHRRHCSDTALLA